VIAMTDLIRDFISYTQTLPATPKAIISLVVILIAAFILYVLWLGSSNRSNPNTDSKANSNTAAHNNKIVWDDHLGHSYSGFGSEIRTSAFQIGVRNNLGHELRLERVYAVSGEGAGEKEMEIAAGGGWVKANRLRPLGNQQALVLRLPFDYEPAKNVFDNWKTFQITLVYNGGLMSRKDVTELMVRSVYENFRPSPIGPQVRTK
jgi:hypothetical protein